MMCCVQAVGSAVAPVRAVDGLFIWSDILVVHIINNINQSQSTLRDAYIIL